LETITITLNGVAVSGHAGMTVLDLARESGLEIPTLCDDANLKPFGACRICLVEEERSGALLAACVTPIRGGMEINTQSPRVLERRKTIIKLMLASHPDSCLICDKGNRCQLRQVASDMGVGLIDLERIPQAAAIEEVNPFIERDLSKCILCAKCIRADQELVVIGAIDYMYRGTASKPSTLNDLPLERSECTFCGTCVAMCPTGALMEKDRPYRGTTKTTIETICPYCGCGCTVSAEVKDDILLRVNPSPKAGVNKGTLCVRGAYGYDFVHSSDRLTSPLLNVEGDFQQVSWEQALNSIAEEFKRVKETHGADSLAILGSPRCTNEENYLLQRLARGILGTNNIDNGSRLYSSASRAGLERSIGLPGTTNSLEELEQSSVIMVIGTDPSISAPIVSYAIKRAVKYKGAKLVLIDPRKTELSTFAHLWLRPRTGTDLVLLNALAKVIIEDKLFDEEFVANKTENLAELSESLEGFTLENAEQITGIAGQEIRSAARMLAGEGRDSIVYGNGITRHIGGADSVTALANIALLTGNVGRQTGGIFALQRDSNARGASEMGALPDFLPGYQSIGDAKSRGNFEKRWGVSLPTAAGLTALEMMEQAKQGEIKGMLIMGENPVLSFPNPSLVKEALASLDCLVVTDLFLTETAKLATMVLPAASFAEKDGTFTNFEGRIQQLRKAIEPLGDSLPDWEIILRLASSMGSPMPYSSPQQIMDEIKELVPFKNRPGKKDSETIGRFIPVEYTALDDTSKDEYPFTLQCGSILYQFGTGSRSSRSSRLSKFCPEAFVEISGDDAEKLSIGDGDAVRVISAAGEITTVARVVDTLPQGMLFMPASFPKSPVNELFDIMLDPQTKTPAIKACAVKLERISEDG